ncbi:MAG: hypothetical protein M3541_23075 [Acidobacteriota bacterium]|nr:hypothetical protein [Acidobacteriota bacterium]
MANFLAAVAILWLHPRGDRFSIDALLPVVAVRQGSVTRRNRAGAKLMLSYSRLNVE